MIKKILPVVLGLVLAAGGFFVYTTFLAGGGPVETPVQAQNKAIKADAADKKKRLKQGLEGPVVSIGDALVVNLADPGGLAFAKLDVSLQVDAATPVEAAAEGSDTGPKLEEQTQIRDIVIDVINSHSASELSTAEGRDRAKQEIIKAVNDQTRHTVVLEVYFPSFAIQQQPTT
jgi:flagellar basal body-associated protein FliL